MKKKIVISAINFHEGGPLSILKDALQYASEDLVKDYEVIALVHDKKLVEHIEGIQLIEYKDSRSSWFKRMHYEYFLFKKLSLELKPFLWLSLHDMTPNVVAERRAVYCHNPTPFYSAKPSEFLKSPKVYLFSKFYKYLYRINIKQNTWVVVQQNWMREAFKKMFNIKNIIVANPKIELTNFSEVVKTQGTEAQQAEKVLFFFPSFPRVFKNFEVICQAAELLEKKGITNFEVSLTIDGSENPYSKGLVDKYSGCKSVNFLGLLPREEVFNIYLKSNCLIFPSRLETWGLPITEYKLTGKPILAADLPYAKETVGHYPKVKFFDPLSPKALAGQMEDLIAQQLNFDKTVPLEMGPPFSSDWKGFFELLLN